MDRRQGCGCPYLVAGRVGGHVVWSVCGVYLDMLCGVYLDMTSTSVVVVEDG